MPEHLGVVKDEMPEIDEEEGEVGKAHDERQKANRS